MAGVLPAVYAKAGAAAALNSTATPKTMFFMAFPLSGASFGQPNRPGQIWFPRQSLEQ